MASGIADKKGNALPHWGNEKTMNLNNLILTNILSSRYFKVNLYQLKTYHEVIDEIYYQVSHLEPWERGSRNTSGQTGMCGGVRGVGAGGIVSTAFSILYKLYTLKLTRKQVVGLINHGDSAYIRALGFMYIRYTQPPADLWDWYESYLEDQEELDVKAGGGQMMSIGEMLQHFLSKLEWFSTLFPRIPVPIQKDLERKLSDWRAANKSYGHEEGWNDGTEQEAEWSEEQLYEKSNTLETDLSLDVAREKDRQRKDNERHAGSARHRTPDRHRDNEKPSSRGRSRSPLRSSEARSHRGRETERHRDRHRERDGEKSRHRIHEHHKEKNSRRDAADQEERWLSKAEWSEEQLYEKSNTLETDLSLDIAREKDRQRKDNERHAGSARHRTSDRHRDNEKPSSRGRSRSPLRSSEARSHQGRETERHRDRYRERDGEKSRHRIHEHHKEKNSRRDAADQEERWLSKDKLLNSRRRDSERKPGCSYSQERVKHHEKHSSRTRDRHQY